MTLREMDNVYDVVSNRKRFTFREWLLMYNGTLEPQDARRYKGVLATRFNDAVAP
ncbi:hypothetical protein [Hydrogenophaga sp. IBVHS1]|uniref:hypothetical protein n=1 Tax=unclassified Hydrogenophaga TaxID=2610897 RepID=UPI0015C4FDFA|nr:hypothetical protein [Hydrogenophaga sp. IBVHS1]